MGKPIHACLCVVVLHISNVVVFDTNSISEIYFSGFRNKRCLSLLMLILAKQIGLCSRGLDSKRCDILSVAVLNCLDSACNVPSPYTDNRPSSFEYF